VDNKADEAILALLGGLKSIADYKLQAMQKKWHLGAACVFQTIFSKEQWQEQRN
jgi:hypothetical protein